MRQAWAAYREKQLKDARERAQQDWQNLGNKLAVENNQAVQRALEPRRFLNLDGQAYLSDIEMSKIADTNGQAIDFCTTFFSPSDVFDPATPWTRISMTREEITTLVASAPADLKTLFPGGSADDGLISLSFEYNNVAVIRPWFRPEFFTSRSWQSVDNSVVSDGQTPRHGKLPAYVTSMLVVRNVTITRTAATQGQTPPLVIPIVNNQALKDLLYRRAPTLDPNKLRPINPVLLERSRLVPSAAMLPRTLDRSAMLKGGKLNPGMAKGMSKGAIIPPQASPAVAKSQRLTDNRGAMLETLSRTTPLARKRFIDTKYDGMTIKSPRVNVPPKMHEAPASGTVTEPYAFAGVAVLAFICNRVPKAPNPDITLTWT